MGRKQYRHNKKFACTGCITYDLSSPEQRKQMEEASAKIEACLTASAQHNNACNSYVSELIESGLSKRQVIKKMIEFESTSLGIKIDRRLKKCIKYFVEESFEAHHQSHN